MNLQKLNLVRIMTVLLLIGFLVPMKPVHAQPMSQTSDIFAKTLPVGGVPRSNTASVISVASVIGPNVLQDPGFESSYGSAAYWGQYSLNFGSPLCTLGDCGDGGGTAGPRTGSVWVWLGGTSLNEVGNVYQNVAFPNCGAQLQFYFWIGVAAGGSDANDKFVAAIDGNQVFSANATQQGSYPSYTLVTVDVSAYANGGVHTVEFYGNTSGQVVNFNLDDVSLVRVCDTAGAVKGDYDGDGKKDIAVFRESNSTWYIRGIGPSVYGTTGDIPVPADYNGDGKVDIAVFRPTNSTWYLYGVGPSVFGTIGDIPV